MTNKCECFVTLHLHVDVPAPLYRGAQSHSHSGRGDDPFIGPQQQPVVAMNGSGGGGDGGGWWGSLRSPRHHSPHSETRPRHLTSLWASYMRLEGGIQFVNKLLIDREETVTVTVLCRVLNHQ